MTVSEQQNGIPQFEASPCVKVLGWSITEALFYAFHIQREVSRLLLPADGWLWEDLEQLPGYMREWARQNKPAASRLFPPPDEQESYPEMVGFVQNTSTGLFEARIGTVEASERVGLTNDLNDAKYLVAEAIRVRRAGQNVEDPPGIQSAD